MFVYYFDVIESGVGPQNYTFGSGCPARPMTWMSSKTNDLWVCCPTGPNNVGFGYKPDLATIRRTLGSDCSTRHNNTRFGCPTRPRPKVIEFGLASRPNAIR